MKSLSIFMALAAVLSGEAAQSAPEKVFTLRDSVREALEHSPLLDSARRAEVAKDLERKNASAKLWPQLNLSAIHGLQGDDPVGEGGSFFSSSRTGEFSSNPTEPWASGLNLSLTENLYDNGASLTNLEIARIQSEIATEAKRKTRDTVILEVHREFYDYSLATALLKVRDQQLATLEKQSRSVKSQYEQGFKTRNDYLRLRAQVLRAEMEKLSASKTIEVSAQNLRKLIGIDLKDGTIAFSPIEVSKAQLSFPKESPDSERAYDVRIARLQERVSEKGVDLANRRYWPRISLTSSISYQNSSYLGSGQGFGASDRFIWDALVKLEYSVWDWGQSRRDVEIARISRMIESNDVRQALLENQAQSVQLMADLDRATKSHKIDQELLSLEEETYKSVERQYREGKLYYLDLINALNNLLDAQLRFYGSYFETLKGVARHKYLEGSISDGFGAE